MSDIKNKPARKIIPLIAILGGMGGIAGVMMETVGSSDSYTVIGIYTLLYALTGTFIGYFSVLFFEKRGQNIVARNHKSEILLVKQPVYLVASIAMIIAFISNMAIGTGAGLVAALVFGLTFLLGLSNGIFDYRESVTKNLLMAAVLPIGITFVYGYYGARSDIAVNNAWLFGSIYLFAYILFLNRMQLNSIIFFRKSVNIEDSRRIRTFNDWLIILLYVLYLVLFNFRKMLTMTYEFGLWLFGKALIIMEAITNWLLVDVKGGAKEIIEKEKADILPDVKRPFLEILLLIIMYTVFGAVCIGIIISLVILVKKIIIKIKDKISTNYNKSMSEKKTKSNEYEEKSEIVKDEDIKNAIKGKKKRMKYNLRKLSGIPLGADKVRYVYGFVLERLYHKHVAIEESDTPEQIINRIKKYKNGEKLTKLGFDEFTEEYRKARYSGKDVDADNNLVKKGEEFEKAVSSIYVDPTEDKLKK